MTGRDERSSNFLTYLFGGASAFLIVAASGLTIYKTFFKGWGGAAPLMQLLLMRYSDVLLVGLLGVICAYISFSLSSQRINADRPVIRREDRELIGPLISEPKPEAIDQYIRLAALSGVSGIFTRLGFTGLPLATVVLTLFFYICALVMPADSEIGKGAYELTQLTLGAFIGSFVQRNVDTQRRQDAPPGRANLRIEPELPV